jgi:hypothetical protein
MRIELRRDGYVDPFNKEEYIAMSKYNFVVGSFVIHNTRSRHNDTDYISASVAVAGRPPLKATQKLGDLNNGTYRTAMNFKDVEVADNETAVFTYAIVNSGHTDPNTAEKTLEQAVSSLAQKGAQIAATGVGAAIGAGLGASIGTAVVPVVGTALGALAGWLVTSAGNLVFANCDGTVAAGVHAFTGAQLRASQGGHLGATDHHPGTDSPHGCGSNSNYDVSWSISAGDIATVFDLNGSWAAGGKPGPKISLSGNAITVDMSAYARPTAHGSVIDPQDIKVTFTDGGTFTGRLMPPKTISWSNNTAWTKM